MKQLSLLAFLPSLVLSLAITATVPAAAQQVQWKVKSGVDELYVRAGPKEITIGTLYAGDGFRKEQVSSSFSNYWRGRAGGNAQVCGWVDKGYLTEGGSTNIGCGSGPDATGLPIRRWLQDNLAKRINDYLPATSTRGERYWEKDTGDGVRTEKSFSLYGNYDGTTFKDKITKVGNIPIDVLPIDTLVFWRWVSDSGEAVMVLYSTNVNDLANAPRVWAFMRRDALPTYLPYADDWKRTDNLKKRLRVVSSNHVASSYYYGQLGTWSPAPPDPSTYDSAYFYNDDFDEVTNGWYYFYKDVYEEYDDYDEIPPPPPPSDDPPYDPGC